MSFVPSGLIVQTPRVQIATQAAEHPKKSPWAHANSMITVQSIRTNRWSFASWMLDGFPHSTDFQLWTANLMRQVQPTFKRARVTNHFLRTVVPHFLIAASTAIGHTLCYAAEHQDTIQSILSALETRESRFFTVKTRSYWQNRIGEQVVSWERTFIDRDAARRIRYESLSGGFDLEGAPISKSHWIRVFDSQNTINSNLKHHSESPTSSGDQVEATVLDRPNPDPEGPFVFRDPMNITSKPLILALQECLGADRPVAISYREVDGRDLVEIDYRRNPGGPRGLNWRATLDPHRDWIVTQIIGQTDKNVIRHLTTAEFRQDPEGRWITSRGTWRLFNEQGRVERGWDLNCEETEVNSTEFDESVFALGIPAGATVFYAPLRVRFQASQALLGMPSIHAAAEAHLATQPVQPTFTKPQNSPPPRPPSLLLIANLGLLVVFVIVIGSKRSKVP